jgi:Membrane magnesium transporter
MKIMSIAGLLLMVHACYWLARYRAYSTYNNQPFAIPLDLLLEFAAGLALNLLFLVGKVSLKQVVGNADSLARYIIC